MSAITKCTCVPSRQWNFMLSEGTGGILVFLVPLPVTTSPLEKVRVAEVAAVPTASFRTKLPVPASSELHLSSWNCPPLKRPAPPKVCPPLHRQPAFHNWSWQGNQSQSSISRQGGVTGKGHSSPAVLRQISERLLYQQIPLPGPLKSTP